MFFSEDKKRVIMIDFGSAEDLDYQMIRQMKIDDDPRRQSHLNFVGTSQYMAPECVRNKGGPSKASDIWSLGVILYQLSSGLLPFRGGSDYLVFRRSTEVRYKIDEEPIKSVIPEEAKDIIKQLLVLDPENRPSIEEVLESEYFKDVRASDALPELLAWETSLKEHLKDFIKRGNVYRFDGLSKFNEYYDENVKKALESNGVDSVIIEHYRSLALLFVFDKDPDQEDLEAEKNIVVEESK